MVRGKKPILFYSVGNRDAVVVTPVVDLRRCKGENKRVMCAYVHLCTGMCMYVCVVYLCVCVWVCVVVVSVDLSVREDAVEKRRVKTVEFEF